MLTDETAENNTGGSAAGNTFDAPAVAAEPTSATASVPDSGSESVPVSTSVTMIEPLYAPLQGTVRVPGDKSISHRAVLFSAMAEGISHVTGVLDSADVRSSLSAVCALGALVDISEQQDGSLAGSISGWGGTDPHTPSMPIDCGNSGTTVRLLMGILAGWDIRAELTGDASLRKRPMRRIATPLEMMGVHFDLTNSETLPLVEHGTSTLRSINYTMPVASAQLKSAILLAGTQAHGITVVEEPSASRNHTELMLPQFGVPVEVNESKVSVEGPILLHGCDVSVPGDPSSAAFIVCAAVMTPQSDVTVENVLLSNTRTGFIRVLERMGACVNTTCEQTQSGEPSGSVHAEFSPELHGCEVEAHEIASLVDEVVVLSLVAAHAQGTTVFHGVGELRVKETDRLAAIIEGLSLIGVQAHVSEDDLIIEGEGTFDVPDDVVFDTKGDHRLAMTWALIGLCGKVPVYVKNFEAVAVSYPNFLSCMQKLGA